jgi:cobalt/nickel transport system permease protein
MHIPDGFLDTKTAIATTVLSGTTVAVALRRLHRNLQPSHIPLLGLASSFIFVAQMLNFPIIGGTSGHMIGAVLAAVLLGPDAAILCLTAVLLIQAFIFADGGIASLGANILNMGGVAVLGGYPVYRVICKLLPGSGGKIAATVFASWFSIVLASIFCAGELAWSGTSAWAVVFPAMTNIHMIIGIGEGLITGLVIAAIYKTKPVLLETSLISGPLKLKSTPVLYTIIFIIALLLFVTPFVSRWPDGLKSVASAVGFDARAISVTNTGSLLPGYTIPGVKDAPTATILAGFVGIIVVFISAFIIGRILLPKSKRQTVQGSGNFHAP